MHRENIIKKTCFGFLKILIPFSKYEIMDETDVNDELVTTLDTNIYGKINEYYNGSIFILNEYIEDKATDNIIYLIYFQMI